MRYSHHHHYYYYYHYYYFYCNQDNEKVKLETEIKSVKDTIVLLESSRIMMERKRLKRVEYLVDKVTIIIIIISNSIITITITAKRNRFFC